MISSTDLRILATTRLQDAQILLANQRYDGAVYVCGYAVELSLKARICDTLDWTRGYPETTGEFKDFASFKVHNLNVLLLLSGRENTIKRSSLADWSIVKDWKPEMRYRISGGYSQMDAQAFLQATSSLLQQI